MLILRYPKIQSKNLLIQKKTIYSNTMLLFEGARNDFSKHNKFLFLLLLESLNDQFNQGFVDSD